MCKNCVYAKSEIAQKMIPNQVQVISILAYAVLENGVASAVDGRYCDRLEEDQRQQIITDTVASYGTRFWNKINKDVAQLMTMIVQAMREASADALTMAEEGDWQGVADEDELARLMEARERIDLILEAASESQVFFEEEEDDE